MDSEKTQNNCSTRKHSIRNPPSTLKRATPMNELSKQMQRDILLIDELISNSSEKGCVEFKHNNEDPEMIGKLCSALSNAARIEQEDFGYVVWGIEDKTHNILGTTFSPESKKKRESGFYFLAFSNAYSAYYGSFQRCKSPKRQSSYIGNSRHTYHSC